jgi:pimeloyl-ACP methyl ester carboxylesterase
MRGYGRSSAPPDPALYTPLHTAGDLVGLLDALSLPSAVIVGHDWGATHAWNAAVMRPDRFKTVFCLAVPYFPRGDVSVFERMRATGHENDFYMFEQIKPEADEIWANAAVTIPGMLDWASGSAPADQRWNPLDPARSLHRPAPKPLPLWADPEYVAHNIAEFQRTGFHGALNYYRAAELFFRSFRCLERRADHATIVLHFGKGRRPERALSPCREASGGTSRPHRVFRDRERRSLDTTRGFG